MLLSILKTTKCLFMDFSEVFERIKRSTDIQTLKSLAEVVGCKPQQVSRKNKENNFPADWAFIVAGKYKLSTDWVLTGKGPRSIGERSTIESSFIRNVDLWIKEESHNDQDFPGYFRFTFKKNFPVFEDWLKRRDSQESENNISPSSKVA